MKTVNEMLETLKRDRVLVKTAPDDILTLVGGREMTEDELRGMFGAEYGADLVGFEDDRGGYHPVFATLQDQWDAELEDFCERKMAWCNRYGCE